MTTLYEAVYKVCGQHSASLVKHLAEVGISTFEGLTPAGVTDFVNHLKGDLAPNSAKVYASQLCKVMKRYRARLTGWTNGQDEVTFAEMLRIKGSEARREFLNLDELAMLERVVPEDENERYVLNEFLLGCQTGARHSDLEVLSEHNITPDGRGGWMLTYTSIKTGESATVPISQVNIERIKYLRGRASLPLMTYNRIIKRLCHRAGIDTPSEIYWGGQSVKAPKWQFITSHSARVSIVTNLSIAGMPLDDIARVVGHKNSTMTEHYRVRTMPTMNDEQLKIFLH